MRTCSTTLLLFSLSVLLVTTCALFESPDPSGFIKCLKSTSTPISKVIYTAADNATDYTSIFQFSMRNPRFLNSNRTKPSVIVTPVAESQVQAVVYCARKYDMQIRTRCGGHDWEALSYTSTYTLPFVLIDMINLRSVTVDPVARTAIVQAGATLGEVYYWVNRGSPTLTFPAGVWSTVGATGLICGGGYGPLRRKYGFAADNVLDARIIDVHGNILDRKAMGEDLFWAIRGGTCASFGVILSWKLNLVEVPPKVTIFTIFRYTEDNAAGILYPYQTVAPVLPQEVDIRVRISTVLSNTSTRPDNKTIELAFTGSYLGPKEELLAIFDQRFPILGMKDSDLQEVTWIQAAMLNSFFNLFSSNYTPEDLLDRTFLNDIPTKAKSDFVRSPMPLVGIQGFFDKLLEVDPADTTVIFTPYGGVLDDSPESAIPFPNRAGTLYMIYARILWTGNTTQKLEWIRSLHDYLTPFVSSNPRRAYYNYDDLDLGSNPGTGIISNIQARKWGRSYFNKNFDRLIAIKTFVDPFNFFRHELTIPTFSLFSQEIEESAEEQIQVQAM